MTKSPLWTMVSQNGMSAGAVQAPSDEPRDIGVAAAVAELLKEEDRAAPGEAGAPSSSSVVMIPGAKG